MNRRQLLSGIAGLPLAATAAPALVVAAPAAQPLDPIPTAMAKLSAGAYRLSWDGEQFHHEAIALEDFYLG